MTKTVLGPITPTFYAQLLSMQIPKAQSSLSFYTFVKSSRKMLVQLTPGANFTNPKA
jgi:hypothetical protein